MLFAEMGCWHVSACVSSGPPRVSEKVTHRQSARIGSAIKLPCPVDGDPPPLIMWTKDGRNIHSGWIRFRILRMGLKIKEVEADDSGTYICKATNGFGSVNINHTLIVIGEWWSSNILGGFNLFLCSFVGSSRMVKLQMKLIPHVSKICQRELGLLLCTLTAHQHSPDYIFPPLHSRMVPQFKC